MDQSDIDELIWAAYRQVFSEHVVLKSTRQPHLESQLANRAISVRDFIRGLAKSETFRRLVVETNSNYRLVEIALKRLLGRAPYNKDEELAWSIRIATDGWQKFVDTLVDSDEYTQNFGDNTVPYQRRRYKDRPFNLVTPRYGDYWRDKLENSRYKWGDIRNFLEMAIGQGDACAVQASVHGQCANPRYHAARSPDCTGVDQPDGDLSAALAIVSLFDLGEIHGLTSTRLQTHDSKPPRR